MTLTQKVVAVLVLAAVAVGVLLYMGRAKTTETPVVTTSTSQSLAVPIAPMVTEKHDQKDSLSGTASKSYTLSMTYPQSSGTQLPEVYSFVHGAQAQFLDDYTSLTSAQAQDFPAEALAYEFNVTTRVATSTNTVTYIIETYQFEGGAHGGTDVDTFTYDKSGKLVTLDDVFAKPYLVTIASSSRQYFYNTLGDYADKDMIDSGTEATSTNFSTWYLTPSTVTFMFGQYQVGPYVIGIQEFPIQKSAIKNLLAPAFQ